MKESTSPIVQENYKKNIILFLTGQTISLFGSSLVQFAIIWFITLETKSGLILGIATICGFLPQICISLFAGVWADRYPRKNLIIIADGLIAISTLCLIILFLLGHKGLGLLFVVSAIRSLGAGVQTPAVSALIPQLVPADKLMKVNGIHSSLQALMLVASPAVSGALLGLVGLEATFYVDVITAVIAICFLLFIKIPVQKEKNQKVFTGYFNEINQGYQYIKSNRFIRALIIFSGIYVIFIAPAALLTPLQVARSFGEEVWRLTVNEIVFSAGAVLGGVIISVWGGFKNRITTIVMASTAFGIMTVLLGIVNIFVVYLIVMGVIGIFVPFFNTASMVLIQENVPEDKLGRVFSFMQIVTSSAMPLGMLLFSPLSDYISVEAILIITGIIMVILGVILYYNKALRQPTV